ncbi:MAG: dTDP-4-dehydrorhamnose reductase [Anaerolineae bacterium]|nr:dTDP-4-dehydrorhamnose reductase [Anaerolineae bacterium]
MRVMITGALGRLGGRLVELMRATHDVTGVDIDEFDITDPAATMQAVREAAPELVIHCAAMTDVDGCARNPDLAMRVNAYGTGNIALACQAVGAAMAYISSNEVFDGQKATPYLEYDPTNPINPYGYSKWAGEQAVRDALARFYIVRTSWLFAHGGRNFVQAILSRVRAGESLRVVTDEVAAPTYNDDLADAISALVQTGRYGVYHLVNEGSASRYDFARYVLDTAGYASTPIEPITLAEFGRPSQPPPYGTLRNFAAAELLGIRLRPWEAAVDAFLAREAVGETK